MTTTIDRRAIWKRLMDRAAASQRTPTIHEPAGYEFQPTMTPELVESLPQEAQTELALQLSKLVLDTSRVTKRREIRPPVAIDTAKVREGLKSLLRKGRFSSRQGPAIGVAIREGSLTTVSMTDMAIVGNHFESVTPEEAAMAVTCMYCRTPVKLLSDIKHMQSERICPICYDTETRECPECHRHDYWWEMQRGPTTPVCRTCSDRLMTLCPACGETVERGMVINRRCPACAQSRYIREYHYKPTPVFFMDPDNPTATMPVNAVLCMGVELETELPSSINNVGAHAYAATRGIDDLIYAKHDGSLNHGVEYVSHPFSWAWLKGKGQNRWSTFLEKLRDTEHSSYDPGTCGMHVHVTKRFLLGDTLYRLLDLAHTCPGLMLALSRREESSLIQWANPRGGQIHTFTDLSLGHGESSSKYTAINVTNKTVEFRLFRGTINTTGFLGNLEAVKAMLDFCSGTEVLSAPKFMAFVEAHADTFPNLLGAILRTTTKV